MKETNYLLISSELPKTFLSKTKNNQKEKTRTCLQWSNFHGKYLCLNLLSPLACSSTTIVVSRNTHIIHKLNNWYKICNNSLKPTFLKISNTYTIFAVTFNTFNIQCSKRCCYYNSYFNPQNCDLINTMSTCDKFMTAQ